MDQERNLTKSSAWLTVAILLLSIEMVFLLGAVMSFIPNDHHALLPEVFPKDLNIIKKDWKMWVYHGVIGFAIVMAIVAVTRFKKYFFSSEITQAFKFFCQMVALFIFLEAFAVVFIIKHPEGQWAWHMLGGVFLSSILSKIFLPELSALYAKRHTIMFTVLLAVMVFLLLSATATAKAYFVLWIVTIGTGIAIINKIHLKSIKTYRWMNEGADVLVWLSSNKILVQCGAVAGAAFIISLLAIIDPVAVLAKTAFGEHYYHFDFMLMASAYASSMGHVLGVDHNVFYGLGMPIMVGALAKFIYGQVNYLSVMNVYWWLSILYYVAFFLCLRMWLGSVLLALGAVLLAIKWQVFYSLSYPVSPIYPNGSPLRCFFDIPVLILLYMHLQRGHRRYLGAAAAILGCAMFFMPTTGIDLFMGFLAYVFAITLIPSIKTKDKQVIFALGIPVIVALVVFFVFCGNAVLHKQFWRDLMYYPGLFTNGFYDVWFWDNLMHGKYLDFVMGCIFPLLYLGTFLWIGLRLYWRAAPKEELITCVICVYGLSLYHHYLVLSLQNNFYMRAIPFVWVMFYWVNFFMSKITSQRRRALTAWGIGIGCAVMLLTNHLYAAFPNFWNTRSIRNPMVDPRTAYALPEDGRPYFFHQDAFIPEKNKLKLNSDGNTDERLFFEWQVPDHATLKRLYAQEFNFSQDAALIQSLTSPKDKVPLLSSFEIEMLIQAKRRPFFFYLPIIASRGLNIRTFPHTNIYTRSMARRTVDDLAKHKPIFVFMERIFLDRDLPASYAQDHEDILGIIDYILANYHPYKQGQYLVAMQRN